MHTGVLGWAAIEEGELQSILDEEDNVKTRIIFAREELKVHRSSLIVNGHALVLQLHEHSNTGLIHICLYTA